MKKDYINYMNGLWVPLVVAGVLASLKAISEYNTELWLFVLLGGIASWLAAFVFNVGQIVNGHPDTKRNAYFECRRTGFAGFVGGAIAFPLFVWWDWAVVLPGAILGVVTILEWSNKITLLKWLKQLRLRYLTAQASKKKQG